MMPSLIFVDNWKYKNIFKIEEEKSDYQKGVQNGNNPEINSST